MNEFDYIDKYFRPLTNKFAFNLKNEPGEGTSRQEMVVEKAGNGITKRGTIGDKKRLKKKWRGEEDFGRRKKTTDLP